MRFDGICQCENDRPALTVAGHTSLNANEFAASCDMLTELAFKPPEMFKKNQQPLMHFVIVAPRLDPGTASRGGGGGGGVVGGIS